MIDASAYTYYLTYAMICACLGVTYIKLKSMERLTITTKEFKKFQQTFLIGYSVMILGELIANASFYHSLITLGLTLEQITKLYIVTIISTTMSGILIDIVDIGTRKDKCCASALLFSASMFTFFFGGHYEMLMIGRVTLFCLMFLFYFIYF